MNRDELLSSIANIKCGSDGDSGAYDLPNVKMDFKNMINVWYYNKWHYSLLYQTNTDKYRYLQYNKNTHIVNFLKIDSNRTVIFKDNNNNNNNKSNSNSHSTASCKYENDGTVRWTVDEMILLCEEATFSDATLRIHQLLENRDNEALSHILHNILKQQPTCAEIVCKHIFFFCLLSRSVYFCSCLFYPCTMNFALSLHFFLFSAFSCL